MAQLASNETAVLRDIEKQLGDWFEALGFEVERGFTYKASSLRSEGGARGRPVEVEVDLSRLAEFVTSGRPLPPVIKWNERGGRR